VYAPSIAESSSIGIGQQVRIPKYFFKLVYDEETGKAWACWQKDLDEAKASPPISYGELVKRTRVRFLTSVNEAATQPPWCACASNGAVRYV
jgi:endonuclease G